MPHTGHESTDGADGVGGELVVPMAWLYAEYIADELLRTGDLMPPTSFEFRAGRDALALTVFLSDTEGELSGIRVVSQLENWLSLTACDHPWQDWVRTRMADLTARAAGSPPRPGPRPGRLALAGGDRTPGHRPGRGTGRRHPGRRGRRPEGVDPGLATGAAAGALGDPSVLRREPVRPLRGPRGPALGGWPGPTGTRAGPHRGRGQPIAGPTGVVVCRAVGSARGHPRAHGATARPLTSAGGTVFGPPGVCRPSGRWGSTGGRSR